MRHDALSPVNNAPNPANELARYLASAGSALSVEQATEQAIVAWIAADRAARSTREGKVRARGDELSHDGSERSRADDLTDGHAEAEYAGADCHDSGEVRANPVFDRRGASHESRSESRNESRNDGRNESRNESRSVGESPPPVAPPLRGYRWKLIFLPEGTRLRMDSDGRAHYACVEGDQIIFRGVSVSPRGMTLAVAGDGRNAWSELALCFPGERIWVRASRCRADLRRALLPDVARPYGNAAEGALRGLCMVGTALRGPGMQPPRTTPHHPALDIDPRSHLHEDLHAVMRTENRADMRVEGGRLELRRFGWPHQPSTEEVPSSFGFADAKPDDEAELRNTVPQPEQAAQALAPHSLIERRIPKHRREADFLEDWCAFD